MTGPETPSDGSRAALWLQAIALIGIPGLIAFYLLGMIPYTRPPILEMREEMADIRELHGQTQHLLRFTCYAVWVHHRDEKTAETCWIIDRSSDRIQVRPRRGDAP